LSSLVPFCVVQLDEPTTATVYEYMNTTVESTFVTTWEMYLFVVIIRSDKMAWPFCAGDWNNIFQDEKLFDVLDKVNVVLRSVTT